MIYAIETQGRTVALTEKSDVIARLHTDQCLRDTVIALRSDSGKSRWKGLVRRRRRARTEKINQHCLSYKQ